MNLRIICLLMLVFPFLAQASESFASKAEFAYRSKTGADRRTVLIQGARGTDNFRFESACGSMGERCACLFYRNRNDSRPAKSVGTGVHIGANVLSCITPGSRPGKFRFAQVRSSDGKALTGKLVVRTELRLAQVLNSYHSPLKVRGIFRYSCNRTFFEGEGVNPQSISCLPSQRLGVIEAAYNFYTYRSGEDRNDQGGDAAFPSDICGMNNFLKIQCTGNTPELRYGFYKEFAEPFVVGISMTRAPEGENLSDKYGYAALPDSAGFCPPGLEKTRAWVAQPASIVEGSIDGTNPPSSFVNENNALNNTVVEMAQPANFTVQRRANKVPCSAVDGSCYSAEMHELTQVQSVGYTMLTPVVCAIPAKLLHGLF